MIPDQENNILVLPATFCYMLINIDDDLSFPTEAYLLHLKKNIELRKKVGYVRFAVVCVLVCEFVCLYRVENPVL